MLYNQKQYLEVLDLSLEKKAMLIAVSKKQSVEKIQALFDANHKHFAENYVQEFVAKASQLSPEIIWHFIGHLQSNKAKEVVKYATFIHSIDSYALLVEIQKQAQKINKNLNVLLQLKIAQEETKFGLDAKELEEVIIKFLSNNSFFSHIKIVGLMGMASFINNENQVRQEFENLNNFFYRIKEKYFLTQNNFTEISIGMSHDYKIALDCGSTMLRIGSLIFGDR